MHRPVLNLIEQGSGKKIEFKVQRLFNGGYAGRDQDEVKKHVEELALIGVPAPSRTPTLYAVSNYLATTDDVVQVQHCKTSGEVEYALLLNGGEIYVTVGSDHTDRDMEIRSVEWSKQAYPDVLATKVWRYEDVAKHWDELLLRCWVVAQGERRLYQEGTLAELLPPSEWLAILDELFGSRPDNTVLMSGTIPTIGGLCYADSYEMELHDPVLRRTLRHGYRVEVLTQKVI